MNKLNLQLLNFSRVYQRTTIRLLSSSKKLPIKYVNENPDPYSRTFNYMKDDIKDLMKGKLVRQEGDIFPSHCDIVIIGGGIIGSSIAYFLKQRNPEAMHVSVIEQDPTYARSSTVLSVGGLRQQFSLQENIEMSLFGLDFLRNSKRLLQVRGKDPPEVQFVPHGYLFLATESGAETMKENFLLQKKLGAKVELLTPEYLKGLFPWLNLTDIALGCHGIGNEGWFDPWSLLCAFKQKAIELGVKYVKGEVTGFEFENAKQIDIPEDQLTAEDLKIQKISVKMENGEYRSIVPALIILAAGANSGHIARLAKIGADDFELLKDGVPVEPRKRYVYVIHCQNSPGIEFPLVIDPTGVYCRREGLGGHFLCGRSPAPNEEPDVSHLDVDYSFFETHVWPQLAYRIPSFEAIQLKSAWAGYYDYNTFDQNAIVGYHPHFRNMFFATGFSGHGIQQAPAIGRAIMEYIYEGSYQTINLSRFSFNRILDNQPLYEKNIV